MTRTDIREVDGITQIDPPMRLVVTQELTELGVQSLVMKWGLLIAHNHNALLLALQVLDDVILWTHPSVCTRGHDLQLGRTLALTGELGLIVSYLGWSAFGLTLRRRGTVPHVWRQARDDPILRVESALTQHPIRIGQDTIEIILIVNGLGLCDRLCFIVLNARIGTLYAIRVNSMSLTEATNGCLGSIKGSSQRSVSVARLDPRY